MNDEIEPFKPPKKKSLLLGSVTGLGCEHIGRHVIVGSHGGLFTGAFAVRADVASLICHDAGVGLDGAGVKGLGLLNDNLIPAAAACFESARIGDPQDMLLRGVISYANNTARVVGVLPGQPVREAADILSRSILPKLSQRKTIAISVDAIEQREVLYFPKYGSKVNIPVVIVDSASLVRKDEDARAIVVTGSHGGLPGGRVEAAIRADVLCAVFNDAGVGIDQAGISRLPALEHSGIAGITIDAWSARIGEGQSTFETGTISRFNQTAEQLGAKYSTPVREFITQLIENFQLKEI